MKKKIITTETIIDDLKIDFRLNDDLIKVKKQGDITIICIKNPIMVIDEKKDRVLFLDRINHLNRKLPFRFHIRGV